MSNKAGKADKADGVRLIEAFLRVIAVKKHKKGSQLLAWYMENVPKSRDFIREEYTFKDLHLTQWAKKNSIKSTSVALRIKGEILNAGDYGAPQERKRFIAGEWIASGEFIAPRVTHTKHKTVNDIRSQMPRVNESKGTRKQFIDPNYPSVKITVNQLTDHFYDTGVYKLEWEKAEFLKTNHPFMGKMSFPENEGRTSRTIMATRSAITREAILYKSEYDRKGDGEYRLPTIREVASLMGFPYVYQFSGTESIKWRQIGNSVCPHQSAALAKALRKKMGMSGISPSKIAFSQLRPHFEKVSNLNAFQEKEFDAPRKRNKNARFRRHALKAGNMTVDLMNYHPERREDVARGWHVVAFFGTGEGYGVKVFSQDEGREVERILQSSLDDFGKYKKEVEKLSVQTHTLQELYEKDFRLTNKSNPVLLLKELSNIISNYNVHNRRVASETDFFYNREVPLSQMMSVYGLLAIIGGEGVKM